MSWHVVSLNKSRLLVWIEKMGENGCWRPRQRSYRSTSQSRSGDSARHVRRIPAAPEVLGKGSLHRVTLLGSHPSCGPRGEGVCARFQVSVRTRKYQEICSITHLEYSQSHHWLTSVAGKRNPLFRTPEEEQMSISVHSRLEFCQEDREQEDPMAPKPAGSLRK